MPLRSLDMSRFEMATRQAFLLQNTIPFVDSAPQFITLPQVGLLAKIRLLVSGTTTTAAASSATRKAYIPAPFSIVRRLILRSSEGADIYNTSGWGNYLFNRTNKFMGDYAVNDNSLVIPTAPTPDPFPRYFSDGGDLGASATTNWRFMLSIPVSLGPRSLTGLLMMQNPGVQFQLEIQWGTVTDLYTTTGTVTLTNVQAIPEIEIFHLPENFDDDPDLGFARNIIEELTPFTNTGDVPYVAPLSHIYMKLLHMVENNSLPIDMSKVNTLKLQYAQTQVAYNMKPDIHLWRQRQRYGMDLPPGLYVHDLGMPDELPEFPGPRDWIDTGFITDFKSIINIDSSTSLVSAQLRTIRDTLAPTE
jgi:hypothetical protein